MKSARGIVYLVGAGPGDPGLITVRGRALIKRADVIVYDRLIGKELLDYARLNAKRIDVGKTPGSRSITQQAINKLLVEKAREGLSVVRLKGGDPFVFGRGYEELAACRGAGITCIVVPGVTSAIAGPASSGIPITDRRLARSFAVITASYAPDSPPIDFAPVANVDTLVVMMGRARLPEVTGELTKLGRDPNTPAACVEQATTPNQRVIRGTLATITEIADREQIKAPMVAVFGDVAALADADQPGIQGKRILITKAAARSKRIAAAFEALGAIPIVTPLIEVTYEPASQTQLRDPNHCNWIAFTSIHGVRGFWRCLRAANQDARSLAGCKIAAVGPATATELNRYGITPDLVPDTHNGAALAQCMIEHGVGTGSSVLLPGGNLSRPDVRDALKKAGASVDEITVYTTRDETPPQYQLDRIQRGVDAVLLFSPSAVRRFVALNISIKNAVVACIGPTTASAATAFGLHVDIIAEPHTSDGMIDAVRDHFALTRVST